jgi:hypothetical protein
MKRCPICGADLARAEKVRRILKVRTTRRWQVKNRQRYNDYHREYQRRLRARKREAASALT